MDNEQDSARPAGVSRGQNQLHIVPEDWRAAGEALEPLLDRLDAGKAVPQLFVVTNDAEAAAGIAARIVRAADARGLRALAATEPRRASRVQRAAPAHIVVGPPAVLVELVQGTVLKLEDVRAVALAWVDDLSGVATRALESILGELPKDAARIVLATAATPEVEQLVERYARRARKIEPAAGGDTRAPVSLSYLVTPESARRAALRRVLDALDPESAFVVTRTEESRDEVESLLRSLGYGAGSSVRVGDTADAGAQLVVLYDFPANEDEVRRIPRARVVALVGPRQVAALRRFAGGAVTPFALSDAAARARSREDALRDELRAVLDAGRYARELLAIEPLLSEYDGAEIAAAALRLLDADRAKPPTPVPAASPPPMTRLYINVGAMDGVRPVDLIGAITNEAGISRAELGRVDVRDRHATVEVAAAVANAVVSKVTGVSIKGRRALVKVDEGGGRERSDRAERPGRSDRPRPRRDDARPGGPPRGRGGGAPRKR